MPSGGDTPLLDDGLRACVRFVMTMMLGVQGALSQEGIGHITVADLLRFANGSEPTARMDATRELFRRGAEALPDLHMTGAQTILTISPSRSDVIYTLIQGLPVRDSRSRSFGLHIEGPVTREAVEEMGRRHGFRLEPYDPVISQGSPTCYVRLMPGKEIGPVLKEILLTEPSVKTVNLDRPER